jgi:FkbM family methyltransferase
MSQTASFDPKQVARTVLRTAMRIKPLRRALRQLSHRDLLPASLLKRLPVEGIVDVTLPNQRSFLYRSTYQDGIGRSLYWHGLQGNESESLNVFIKLLSRADSFIDIGANTGIYTLIAAALRPDIPLFAFEPLPRVYDALQQNLALNGWRERCNILPYALADYDGKGSFHVPPNDLPTSGSLHTSGFRGHQGELIDVEIRRLDTLFPKDTPFSLAKIDVEGFEDAVLRGMPNLLQQHRPDLIIECNPDGPFLRVQELLTPLGYRFIHLRQGSLLESNTIQPDPQEIFRNFLCTCNPHFLPFLNAHDSL